MKVGDYVRTKHYGISKIINVYYNTTTFFSITIDRIDSFGRLGVNISNDEIIKSSPSIIDLIEKGDYVNGFKVKMDENGELFYHRTVGYEMIKDCEIKSIVTKEQFSQMEYKVGE